jgi:tetratricopeptide (TPR) repeat protein
MVARLADERHRLDELAFDDLAVRSGLTFTCGMLTEQPDGVPAVRLFGDWGVARLPAIGPDLARVLGRCTAHEARAMLDRLAAARLIEPLADDRYRMHDLVRIYAMERGHDAAGPADRRELVHRVRCYFLGTARQARDLVRVNPHRIPDEFAEPEPTTVLADRAAALGWLETERANMVTAIRWAAAEGTGEGDLFAARLAGELYPFLPMRGYYGDWLELSELALACARRLGSGHDEGTALTHVAGARARGGQHREAVAALRAALALREQQGDERAVARALDHLGMALANAGELAEAKRAFQRSIVLHRRHGDDRGLGVTLNNLADAHLKLDENDDALRHLDESLRLRVALGDHLGIGITTLTIGQAYAQKGQWAEALDSLGRALAGARESGNREAEWRALTVRAQLFRVIDRPDQARADLIAALALSEQISDTIGASEVRQALRELPDAAGFSADRRS